VAGAPLPVVYHQCTRTQWDDWYKLVTGLGERVEPFELLVTLAQELRKAHSISWSVVEGTFCGSEGGS
jgi:hypothetical protein